MWGMKNLETLNQIIKRIFNFKLEKSWNIEPNETKSQYLICSYLWCDTWEYFNFFRIERATWQNLILSYMRSLLLYIQVNSQTMSLRERERERERERDALSQSRDEIEKKERIEIPWCCLRSRERYGEDRGSSTLQAKLKGTYHCYSYGVWIVHLYL